MLNRVLQIIKLHNSRIDFFRVDEFFLSILCKLIYCQQTDISVTPHS